MTNLMISEDFHSLQGEGQWTGTPMHFIRLAGCNVGKHPSQVTWEVNQDRDFPILKTGRTAYVCHTYDGRPFYCDTDFQKGEPISIHELLDNTWEEHICVTGGEPLLHFDVLSELLEDARLRNIMCHVESSGTILKLVPCWLTVSPKEGCLEEMVTWADEIKLLVDPTFVITEVPKHIRDHGNVYVQPVNGELSVNMTNFRLCMEVLRVRPDWKLSIQLHKFLNVR